MAAKKHNIAKIAQGVNVLKTDNGHAIMWQVPCQGTCSGLHEYHIVRRDNGVSAAFRCGCPAGTFGLPCVHIAAVLMAEMKGWFGKATRLWHTIADAKRQRRHIYIVRSNGVRVYVTVRGK